MRDLGRRDRGGVVDHRSRKLQRRRPCRFSPRARIAGSASAATGLWVALAISSGSEHQRPPSVAWATSARYAELVAAKENWSNAPPGTRRCSTRIPLTLRLRPSARMVLASIESADRKADSRRCPYGNPVRRDSRVSGVWRQRSVPASPKPQPVDHHRRGPGRTRNGSPGKVIERGRFLQNN